MPFWHGRVYGSGMSTETAIDLPCPTCHGRGYHSQPADAHGPADERECAECDGEGQVPDWSAEGVRAAEADAHTATPEEVRMVYPVAPYAPTRDSRASTYRLLLAQVDRWIETHLDPHEEPFSVIVDFNRCTDYRLWATVHLPCGVLERITPAARAEGVEPAVRLTQDKLSHIVTLEWPALGVQAIAYYGVRSKLPAVVQPTRAA